MRASTRAEIPRARALGIARKGRRATTLGSVASPPASSGHHGATSDSMGAGTMPIVVGPPPCEDLWLAKATERIFLPAVRVTLPEVVDYDLPYAGTFHNCAIFSIRKRFPGHALKVMHAIWGTGLLSLTKAVIIVDEWVDPHDYNQVVWQMGANIDPAEDILISRGPLDQLDHAARIKALGGKIGFDATAKWEGEGYTRDWPEVNRIPADVKAQVDERWASLGIPLPGFDGTFRRASEAAPAGSKGMLDRLRGR